VDHDPAGLPSGTVTFVFTDVESSSQLWEQHPDAMKDALARHDALLRSAIADHGGHLLKGAGDGVFAVFTTALDALAAAVTSQAALSTEPWGETGPLLVRMGLHTGEAEERAGDYFGPAVNRAARVMSLAHGGQIVMSRATEALVRDALPESVDLADLGEYRLNKLSRPERVFQVVSPSLRRAFPPLRALDYVAGNLPAEVTSFVGREEESEQVATTLDRARVVTLTGVGGVGKTRLALHVAGMPEVASRFRDGCWLVELAAIREPEAVPDAIAGALNVEPPRGSSVTDAVLSYLRGRHLLLVMDNCEHLLHAVGRLTAQIQQSCADVQVLATSREGLGVAGEWILAVRSLIVAQAGADPETIRGCEAVELFADRARAVRADFAVDDASADAVAQVCRRLDGIALAIELAASRVATLSPAEVARRLDHRFRLLSGGRAAVERHQTLRAAIDWSYELLGPAEQLFFDRLSVFAGGFTLDAVEGVAASDGIEPGDALDLLTTLVAQSLVVAHTDGPQTRYTQYETIRQYAEEQLERRGESERVRDRHARYFATFVDSMAAEHARTPSSFEWDTELDREADNLRAALAWSVDRQDADSALRLLGNINIPSMSAVFLAFRPFADAVVALPGVDENPNLPGALIAAAWGAYQRNQPELAIRQSDAALDAAARLGVEPDPRHWTVRAFVAMAQGALDDHLDYVGRAAEAHRVRGDDAGLAIALGQMAVVHILRGDEAAAEQRAREALSLVPDIHVVGAKAAVHSLAAFGLSSTDPGYAYELITEAIRLNAQIGRPAQLSAAVASHIANRLGNRREALRLSADGLDQALAMGAQPVLGPMLQRAGDMLVPDDPETAAILHGAGQSSLWSARLGTEHDDAVAQLNIVLGESKRAELNERGRALGVDQAVALARRAIASACADLD
jgi:predicted ATPase/class 3 adenylate cyclase